MRAEWASLIKDASLSQDQFLQGLFRSVHEHASEMSEQELLDFTNNVASLLYGFEKELAARGLPRPGNNPNEPN